MRRNTSTFHKRNSIFNINDVVFYYIFNIHDDLQIMSMCFACSQINNNNEIDFVRWIQIKMDFLKLLVFVHIDKNMEIITINKVKRQEPFFFFFFFFALFRLMPYIHPEWLWVAMFSTSMELTSEDDFRIPLWAFFGYIFLYFDLTD